MSIPRELTESHKSADTRIHYPESLKAELRLTLIRVARGIARMNLEASDVQRLDGEGLFDEATRLADRYFAPLTEEADQAITDVQTEMGSAEIIQFPGKWRAA